MDFFLYTFEQAINFGVSSIPLVLVFLQLRLYKLPFKAVIINLLLNLLLNIFFWLKLKDGTIILYQSIPYISSFIWIYCESVLKTRQNDGTPGTENTGDGSMQKNTGDGSMC